MSSQKYNHYAVETKIASHSDTLLQIDDQLKSIIEHFETGNRSALILQCNFVLSQCSSFLSELELLHSQIQDDPNLHLSDVLLTQQSLLYTEYASIASGLLQTLQMNQTARQKVKETQRQLEEQLLQTRLKRKKVNHG